ncbi:hypothetical protein HMPREF3193_01472 [Bifidobacterium breve]|nr:hypothetical protein HMPREF3193_01472 [Bifidobacterium breve]
MNVSPMRRPSRLLVVPPLTSPTDSPPGCLLYGSAHWAVFNDKR